MEFMNRLIMSVNKKVVDLLQDTLHRNPYTDQIILQFMFISDLLPYMQLLSQFENLTSLSLHGNRIKQLPIDMSSLSSIQQLDLSNNIIKDIDLALVSLATLPKLKVLNLPVSKEKQPIIMEKLTKLTLLNNVKVVREHLPKKIELKYMNIKQFQKAKSEYSSYLRKIIHFEKSYLDDKNSDDKMEQKFDKQMNIVIQDAFNKLNDKQGEITESVEFIFYTITQFDLLDLIKNRVLNLCMDIYGDLGKLMRQIQEDQDNLWKSITQKALIMCRFEEQLTQIKKQSQQAPKGMNLEDGLIKKNYQLEKQVKRIKKQKDSLIGEISKLQSQNTRLLQTLVKFSKGDRKTINTMTAQMNIAPTAHSNKLSAGIGNGSNIHNNSMKVDRSKNINRQPPSVQVNYSSTGRNLTVKQLKDTIEEIYQSKLKYDQKNFDGKLPRETMHQYLFTYLNQKYGLKNLTIQAASSIVSGIQAYSPEDNDVAVFGKILRNQVDEQFRNVQGQLKSTINSLLKMHIKNQNPYKSTGEIDVIFKEKTHSEITSQEVQDIVKYLYNKNDSQRILRKIDVLYRLNRPREEPTHRRLPRDDHHLHEKEKKKIKFSRFVQTVLDFQLKNHERLLRPLVSIFRQRDSDTDGIVNQDEFISIIEELCEEANDIIPELLMIVDPYETKSITFTQMVRLVANYPEGNPILSRFIQKEELIPQYEQFE